jgi:dolichyl-diphosphooligosaccharide--protein glycosyltransferase
LGNTVLILSVIIIIVAAGISLMQFGLIENLSVKFAAVLNPSIKTEIPIVESVAEHRPGTWASFFYEFGAMIFLGVFGFYFAAKRGRPSDIFLILFGISSAYFASSFIRLTLIMAPAFAILPAVALVGISKPSLDILKEKLIFPKRRVKAVARVGKEYGVATILILMVALVPSFYYATRSAYMPTTIATSSLGIIPTGDDVIKYQDWLQALVWMRDNLPEDTVIMSWWDYGYWITAIADKRSMADNGTINATQVATIACLFLTNETFAIPVMKRYNISHVAIFVTWYQGEGGGIRWLGAGEDNKWYWMARIGNGTTIGDITYNFQQKQLENEVRYFRLISSRKELVANDTLADMR